MSKRWQCCFGCNTRLGEKTAAGLLISGQGCGVIVTGEAKILCPRCRKPVKVRVAFQASRAQQDGLASTVAQGGGKVLKDGIDWDMIKELHQSNRMEIFPQADGSLVLMAKPDNGEVERVLKTIEDEVINNPNLTPQQREAIAAMAHEAISGPPPQQQQRQAPRPLPPSYAPHAENPPVAGGSREQFTRSAEQRTASSFRQPLPDEDDGIPSGIPSTPTGETSTTETPASGETAPPDPTGAPAETTTPEPVAVAETPSQQSGGGRNRNRNR